MAIQNHEDRFDVVIDAHPSVLYRIYEHVVSDD
jgi:hypothetical protein